MWGSQTAQLEAQLEDTHYIPWRFRTSLPRGASTSGAVVGRLGTALDTLKFRMCQTGGLYFACRRALPVLLERSHVFTRSGSRSGKGCFAALIDVRSRQGGQHRDGKRRDERAASPGDTGGATTLNSADGASRNGATDPDESPDLPPFLLMINVHLDPGHTSELQACQKEQLREVGTFVRACVAAAEHRVMIVLDTQDPATAPGSHSAHVPSASIGVVCCGDWNRDAPSASVDSEIAAGLGPDVVDLAVATATPTTPVDSTFDATNSLNAWSSGHERLDLALNVRAVQRSRGPGGAERDGPTPGAAVPLARVRACSVTAPRQPAGQEVSDHWPLAIGLGRPCSWLSSDAVRARAAMLDTFA